MDSEAKWVLVRVAQSILSQSTPAAVCPAEAVRSGGGVLPVFVYAQNGMRCQMVTGRTPTLLQAHTPLGQGSALLLENRVLRGIASEVGLSVAQARLLPRVHRTHRSFICRTICTFLSRRFASCGICSTAVLSCQSVPPRTTLPSFSPQLLSPPHPCLKKGWRLSTQSLR